MSKKKANQKIPSLDQIRETFFCEMIESNNPNLFLRNQIEANERLSQEFKEGTLIFDKYLKPPNFNQFLELSGHILELYGIEELYSFHNLLIKLQAKGVSQFIDIVDFYQADKINPAIVQKNRSLVRNAVDEEVNKFKLNFNQPYDINKVNTIIKVIQAHLQGDASPFISPLFNLPLIDSSEEIFRINSIIEQELEQFLIFTIRNRTIEAYIDTLVLRECLEFLVKLKKAKETDPQDLSFYLHPQYSTSNVEKVYAAINKLELIDTNKDSFVSILLNKVRKGKRPSEMIVWKGTEMQLVLFLFTMFESFFEKPYGLIPDNFTVEQYNELSSGVRRTFSFWFNERLVAHFKIATHQINTDSLKQTKDKYIVLLNNYSHIDSIAKSRVNNIKEDYNNIFKVVDAVRTAQL